MKNSASTIAAQLDKIGNVTYLKESDWVSMPFRSCLFRLWNKQRSAFEPEFGELGQAISDYYLYIGPADHDITALSDDAVLSMNGVNYEFKRRNPFEVGGEVLYYTAILRKMQESDFYD